MASKTERIEARFPSELKVLAERAALISGITLTDYLANLVRADAPKRLKSENEIVLANQQFDNFIQVCDTATPSPSKKLSEAANRLDSEGF